MSDRQVLTIDPSTGAIYRGDNAEVPGAYLQSTGQMTFDVSSLALFTNTVRGAVPPSGGGTTNYLRADGTWAEPAGGGGGSFSLSVFESDFGALPRYSGSFDIDGQTGLTPGRPVLVQQASGPYTDKGDRDDEAEMDQVQATAYALNTTTIRVHWVANPRSGPLAGNVRFNFAAG